MVARKGYKLTEVGEIPKDWEVKKAETVIQEISMGPFGSDIKVSNFILHGVPVLNGFNVRSAKITDIFANFVSEEKAKSLKKAVASRGDVVITHRGTLGQVSYIPSYSAYTQYVISQSQFRVRFDSSLVEPAWVVIFFLSKRGNQLLLEGKGHTGVPALAQPTTKFRQLFIPLPSVKEQTAIATALSDADALIDALEQSIAKKRNIKQGAMQELLTGKRRLPGFTGEWEEKLLNDIIEKIVGGGTPSRSVSAFWGNEIPWVTVKDFATFNPYQTQESITQIGLNNSASNLIPAETLIVSTRMAIGKTLIYKVNIAINQDLKAVFFSNGVDILFIHYWFEQNINMITALGSGSTVQGISIDDLRRLPISLPSFTEQAAIATVLTDMDEEVAALEAKLAKARAVKSGMMQELLTGRIRLI